MTAPVSQVLSEAADLSHSDWLRIAKLAGEYGIRYRTNAALLSFIAALAKEQGR